MSAEVARREPSLVEVIQQIVSMSAGEGLDRVAMLERIVALKERADEQSRKTQYATAMAELQAKIPQIDARGKIMAGTNVRSRFALIEDLDVQIKPLLAEYGFSFSYDTAPVDNDPKQVRIFGRMTHSAGYSETRQIDMPIETGAMSDQQKRGSTLSHGIRNILRMFLNWTKRGEDTDGTGAVDYISAKDLSVIKALMEEKAADLDRFLKYMAVESLEDIQRRDVQKAMAALKAKAGKKAE